MKYQTVVRVHVKQKVATAQKWILLRFCPDVAYYVSKCPV